MVQNPTSYERGLERSRGPAAIRRQVAAVKRGVRIERVAGDYGKFRLLGSGRLEGRCVNPDHEDKTPSLSIYPDTQIFRCYGCGAHGDVLDLVMLAEPGMLLWEAIMTLSTRYGVELPGRPASWYRRQARQKPVRDGIEATMIHVARRRLYQRFFEPLILATENEENRAHDAELFWEATLPLAERLVGTMMRTQR